MVRQQDWYDPSVISRVRKRISALTWLVVLVMLYLNHEWIIQTIIKIIN